MSKMAGPSREVGDVLRQPFALPRIFRDNVGEFLHLQDVHVTHNDYFGIDSIVYRFVPRNLEDVEDVWTQFSEFFLDVEEFSQRNFALDDYVEMFVSSNNLNHYVAMPLMRVDQFSPFQIIENLARVLNSHKEVAVYDGSVTLHLYHVAPLRGAGMTVKVKAKRNLFAQSLDKLTEKTRSIFKVPDFFTPLCGPVALLLGKHRLENPGRDQQPTRKFRSKRQMEVMKQRAVELCRQAGVSCNRPFSIKEMRKLCKTESLRDFCMIVHDRETFNSILLKHNPR